MRQIAESARGSYSGEPLSVALYSRIIWFRKYSSTQGDVDNMAKRIHDALRGVLFVDDRLITHTMTVRVDASERVELVADSENPAIANELLDSLSDPDIRDILYIEIGHQSESKVYLGSIA